MRETRTLTARPGTLLAAAFLAACFGPVQPAEARHSFPCRLGRYFRPSLGICQGHPYRPAAARRPAPIPIRIVTRTVYVHDRPLPPPSLRAERSDPAPPTPAASPPAMTSPSALPAAVSPSPAPSAATMASSPDSPAPTVPAALPVPSASVTWAGSLNLHPDWITPRPAAP